MNTQDFKDLDKEIYSIREKIDFFTIQYSIGELISMYKDNDLLLHEKFIPNMGNMSKREKSGIIELLLLGKPISSISVVMDKDNRYKVVSGDVELETVLSFFGCFGDVWQLEGGFIQSLKGIDIKSLPLKHQIGIKRVNVCVNVTKQL